MENYTDFIDNQHSQLELTDIGQNTHFPHIDSLSLPNPGTLQDLESFAADTHQETVNSRFSGDIFLSEPLVDNHNVTYDLYSNQYLSNDNWGGQGHVSYAPLDNVDRSSYLGNSQDHSGGEQSSVSTYSGFTISTESTAMAGIIESGNMTSCQSSTPEVKDSSFPSESALSKHEGKPSKPYICRVSTCKYTRLRDKGGLDRHNREVHGSQTYCCPITSCKRHVQGFARKHNLSEHQRRCHPSQSPDLAPPLSLRQQIHRSESVKGKQSYVEGGSSPEIIIDGGGKLRAKLKSLYIMREEIELNIAALERSSELLGEDSP